ncbi:asparagine synthase (glutamine-hydrolyzing) [Agriterribacter sp.]|uniref:asparagine synthase (glutamine-hydrolyzing) n=1 Tax=Agriterribacter sp. TaxID=2821509 RepID=UPI002B53DE54|nr:asparagine synthase (glutamine-hydrolyzing) [Agriterribacter sp.]HRO44685.1 asparagine synthase (glutamine-hydrolyzing) [Agriterribacter sp.]HRQ16357.1 asparagine synthase (glutamine-hydrolyzing) [Agriterribacter sp.]
MCGIAGFINFKDPVTLAQMANRVQQHRGPDSQAHWQYNNVCFAHQRLSIIDLDKRSDQPFTKGNLTIIFNGEIYNYEALKDQIRQWDPSVEFKTTSDTEVLLELYRIKKEKCLDDLNGMFVFAIFETDTNKLFIARDHFGIKPLFYTRINNAFTFSSELKTLLKVPGVNKTLNKKALVAAVNYLWIPGNITCFENIYKLPAAHYILIDLTGGLPEINPIRYWELKESAFIENEAEATAKLKACMENSLQRHMIADVPVSAFLSGGLDSSLISVLAAKHNSRLSTYTIATSDKDKKAEQMPEDERYAKKLAALHHFDHNEILVEADIINDLKEMVYTLDEPIGDPAALNTHLICAAARKKGVKVLLSGMGADEIFFGYRRHKAILLAKRYKKIPAVIRNLITRLTGTLPVKQGEKGIRLFRWAKRFISFANLSTEEAYMRSYSYYSATEIQQLFREDITAEYDWLRSQHRSIFNQLYKDDLINQVCHTDIHMFMQGLNLSYTDRASMAASVEVRVPFIDKEVIELAMKIPGKLKYKYKQSKYILKKVAEDYLPKEIIYRPKASFGAPIRSWISGELRPLVDELLSEDAVNQREIFNYNYIRRIIDNDRKGAEDNAYRLYMLITMELWFRQYID